MSSVALLCIFWFVLSCLKVGCHRASRTSALMEGMGKMYGISNLFLLSGNQHWHLIFTILFMFYSLLGNIVKILSLNTVK